MRSHKVFFVDSNQFPTGFYRCAMPSYCLQKYTAFKSLCHCDASKLSSWQAEQEFISSDIIVLFRPYAFSQTALFDIAEALDKIIIVEMDDYLQEIKKSSPVSKTWTPAYKEILDYYLRACTAITTTTTRLAKIYTQMFGKRVYTLPNQIDHTFDRWFYSKPQRDYLTIGWMGTSTHYDDLLILQEIIPAILRKYDNVKFKFVGYCPDWIEELEYSFEGRILEHKEWMGIFEYPQEIREFDIGLIPIEDHPFNTIGKSDLKFLEYSMLGIPSVASRLHPYKDVIQHKVTGYLVKENDPLGWINYISKLIENEEKRKEIGQKARGYVLKKRTYAGNIWLWAEAYTREIKIKEGKYVN